MSQSLYIAFYMLVSASVIGIYTDIRSRTISNRYCLLILMLACFCSCFDGGAVLAILRVFGILFIGVILFSLSIIGAGDVKLLAAYSVGISTEYWWLTLYLILILGAVLACIYVVYGVLANKMSEVRRRGLPYGVPITLSCLFGIWLSIY
ncbi:A24 family peptidase [Marinomonas algicola]|uniref:A24 family peptidase n=1 Tax=Marinomonas algicola TaxID=2773454 RepID=UPI00174D46B5|nr:prepilin peptidase [Marinomonas algicola]